MGSATRPRAFSRRSTDRGASRLAAIRAVIELADDVEDHDVAIDALMVLGASHHEIAAASLDASR